MTEEITKPAAEAAKTEAKVDTAKKPVARKAPAKRAARKAAPVAKKTAVKTAKKKPARKPAKAKSSPKKDVKIMTNAQTTAVNETIEKMTAAGNEAFKEGFEKSLKSVNEINAYAKENVDAVIASATAAGKNAETLNANAVAYAKTSMESAVAATKALTTAKSVQDMIEVQTDFVKSSMDLFLAELNKTSDLYAGAVKEVSKPINDRFAASVEMVQSAR
ncbi:TIGR01841 family phasin [Hyphobacterium sp. HN65]|uniref:TIGR01841 family phasin n=1 Tax=Hyphobacterium lacteum TaxID=3116575 RepID=A0ABU7LMK2_9PROT|nr:TIGR01841 family phasin [Hyphobacterium sp. HN65]MEE2525146.1 TIGR01841 family phasin [Hyphobacterium sp. HN65]